jgi:hypothetical protein
MTKEHKLNDLRERITKLDDSIQFGKKTEVDKLKIKLEMIELKKEFYQLCNS